MKKVAWTLIVLVLLAVAGVVALPYLKPYVMNVAANLIDRGMTLHERNLERQARRLASEDSARYVIEHMPQVPTFRDKFELFDHGLESVDSKRDGLYCEFGVYTGTTINYIASKTDHTIHGFDSFEGLPEGWRTGFEKGEFTMSGLPKVRENVELHKGWFDKSLPVWAKKHPGPILFMHLDADLYSSTKTVFDILGDRVVPGTVMQFDEYFNYPGWRDGEFKAFQEFVESRQVKFEYLGYCPPSEQVSVRILSIGPAKGK